jgi:hypothetical protein
MPVPGLAQNAGRSIPAVPRMAVVSTRFGIRVGRWRTAWTMHGAARAARFCEVGVPSNARA